MDETFAFIRKRPAGGARRDRTDDLMLAKHALSQLSYGPSLSTSECRTLKEVVGLGRFELPTSRLSSARSNQLSYRPDNQPSPIMRPERKRNVDGGVPPMDVIVLRRCALMFPRDPIEMREAPLKDHP